jgi:hypothetical protein
MRIDDFITHGEPQDPTEGDRILGEIEPRMGSERERVELCGDKEASVVVDKSGLYFVYSKISGAKER